MGLPDIKPTPPPPVLSLWREIEPLPLAKAHRDHPWMFAVYEELNRPDGSHYWALVFRNEDRSVYGIQEGSEKPPLAELRKLAHRVVCDRAFRAGLVADDPLLAELWRRH